MNSHLPYLLCSKGNLSEKSIVNTDLKQILNDHTIFSPQALLRKFITVCWWESNTIVSVSLAFAFI